MQNRTPKLDHMNSGLWLAYVGMETDLIFSQGVDLPGFASFPLMQTAEGRDQLHRYYTGLIAVGIDHNVGIILESPTWVANKDRAAPLGYDAPQLADINRQAVAQMVAVRKASTHPNIAISANLGPRADAYAPDTQMTENEAKAYHDAQIATLAETGIDFVSGYTLAYTAEAIGIVNASKDHGLPVVISFTVETDGRLPTGTSLADAITTVDAATDAYCTYFMINCAHPTHFSHVLDQGEWINRIGGIVANASQCSHAELDEATTLDAGDPVELAGQLADIAARFPNIKVLGGCCGTDMRHIVEIAKAAKPAYSGSN